MRVVLAGGLMTVLPASLRAIPYNATQIEVAGVNNGLSQGGAVWGDFDNDGDLDILVGGRDQAGAYQLRVYRNDGGGAFAAVAVAAVGAGLVDGAAVFGDLDGDGDLDVAACGVDAGGTRRLRYYFNNGNGTFNTVPVDVDVLGAGTNRSDVAMGDFDNDGDLDMLFSGRDAGGRRLRVYRNNGIGTFDPNQIELPGGVEWSDAAWGDFDNDGDLDVLACGNTAGAAASRRLRVHRNNGDGTFDPVFINIPGAANGFALGDIRWGDDDADGDLDVLVTGADQAGNRQLYIYRNNGNGTFNPAPLAVAVANAGYSNSAAVFGDTDNDGDLDVLVGGFNGNRQLRVYRNNGNGTFNTVPVEVEFAPNMGLELGGAAWGDFDGDRDVDVLASGFDGGNRQLRVYRNIVAAANTLPTAPGTLAARFSFSATTVSVASFTFSGGADAGVTATPVNGLYYEVQVSTLPGFTRLTAPGVPTATPGMGGFVRPWAFYGGATPYGLMMKSTGPWAVQNAHPGLLTDTTYYYRVQTIDAGLGVSPWSGTGTLWTGIEPATTTDLAATPGPGGGEVVLTWTAPGDDWNRGNLTGNYRIQYSSDPATVWSTATTPTNAYTVTIATSGVVPGSVQTTTLNMPYNFTYYFRLWAQDDVGQWSGISNAASATPPVIIRSVSVSGTPYNYGVQGVGTSSVTAVAVTVTNDGNVTSTYTLRVATATAGTPWDVGASAAFDTAALFAGFHAARPTAVQFGAEDNVPKTDTAATGTVYSIDGTQTGANVPITGVRSLWFRLDTPTASSTDLPQDMTVTITAVP
jgi:hypothetical protein